MGNCFTKKHTLYIKGMAVLLLLAHHLFMKETYMPLDFSTISLRDLVVVLTKVCVAIFTILSGYGLSKSFKVHHEKTTRFTYNHIKNILINYWYVYIPMFLLSFFFHVDGTPLEIYGKSIKGFFFFLLDFFGIRAIFYSPTLNNTWWYMELVIICYLLFPLFRLSLEKGGEILLLVFTGTISLMGTKELFNISIITDRGMFYLFSFVLGMVLEKYGILDKIVILCRKKKWVLGVDIMFIMLCAMARTQISLIMDVPYALSIIVFCICLREMNFMTKIFEFLGKHSMNIFLIHSFVYYYFKITASVVSAVNGEILKYMVLLLLTLIVSIVVEQIKKGVKIIALRRSFK